VNDATAARRAARSPVGAPLIGRRRILRLALAVPAAAVVLGGCAAADRRDEKPDPLVALADAARADAALAAAAVGVDPALGTRVAPLRAARTAHAAALDAEVARLRGTTPAPPPPAPVTTTTGPPVTLARVQEAVAASHVGAAALVEGLPADRVGLVAAVAACCATYAALLA
jgi:hypothetical protein